MATIFDVAAKAKVSVITVSRLLNNPKIVSSKTADKILRAMDELNYQPSQIARSLVNKRTNTIGVIMPDIKNTFFNSWFRYIEDYAAAHDFNLLLCNTDSDPDIEMKYVKLLQSQRVDGVIIVPSSQKAVEYLMRSNLRFILSDRVYKDLKTNYVTTDHYQGAYDATEYLIKLGHKRIAVLKGPGVIFPDTERYRGFEDAMIKYDLAIDSDIVINCEFNETKAFKATKDLLSRQRNKPTALFSFNSLMTIGAIKAIQNMKLSIPKNISLLSFDEIPGYDIFDPKVTHVYQPVNLLGREAIVALIDSIKKPDLQKKTKKYLKPRLIVGNSCINLASGQKLRELP